MRDQFKMNADKIILIDSTLLIVLYVLALLANMRGEYLGRAYMSLFLMGLFFLIAVAIAIANVFLFKYVTTQWIKFLSFAPILFLVAQVLYLAEIVPRVTELVAQGYKKKNIKKQSHTLTVEIRTPSELSSAINFSLHTSAGRREPYPTTISRREDNMYIHQFMFPLFYENDKLRYLLLGESHKFYLNIDQEPKPASFTTWDKFYDQIEHGHDPIKLEIRFKVTVTKPEETLPYYIPSNEE